MSNEQVRILIVDDEPDYASTLALALRADGLAATSVSGGEMALERLSDTSTPPPDLLITDIVMPGMNGEELIGAARRLVPEMPILAMTAYGDKQMVVRLMRNGCSDYIEKPFTVDELLRHIDPILSRRPTTLNGDEDTRTIRRLAAIGRNVAGFAHDLNNQLAAMNGFGELLSETASDTRQAEYCRSLRKCFYRVGNMVSSVMAAAGSGVPAAAMEQVPVKEVLAAIIDQSNLRTKDVRLMVRDECAVWGHRGHVEAALWNLLKNADEALIGRKDGRITVSCGVADGDVTVSVGDNGPGVAPAIRDRLFGLGQTHGKRRGNGLGLYSARQSLEAMGGTIWCESEPGDGATFYIRLPMHRPTGGAPADQNNGHSLVTS